MEFLAVASGDTAVLTFSFAQQMATVRFVQAAYLLMAVLVVIGEVLGLVSFHSHPLGCSGSTVTGTTPFPRLRFTSLESRDGRRGSGVSTPGISHFELLFHAEGSGRPVRVPNMVIESMTKGASVHITLDAPKIPSCPVAWYFVTASGNSTQADDPVFAPCPPPLTSTHAQPTPPLPKGTKE